MQTDNQHQPRVNTMKVISVTEYAQSRKISRAAVLKRLTPKFLPMPGVFRAEKVGNNWILYTYEKSDLETNRMF